MNVEQRYMYKCPCMNQGLKNKLKGIYVHSVGCGCPNKEDIYSQWNKSSNWNACVTALIDDKGVIECLPDNCRSWHGYKGRNGSCNDTHMSFEIMEPLDMVFQYRNEIKQGQYYNKHALRGVQQQLKNLGYYNGDVDGGFGPQTLNAIKSYQLANKLTVSGYVTSATWRHLGNEVNSVCKYDPNKNADFFNACYSNAVEYVASKCLKYKWNPLDNTVVLTHCEGYQQGYASNHGDVMHWFPNHGKTMDDFRKDVKECVDFQLYPTHKPEVPKEDKHVYNKISEVPEWAKPAVIAAMSKPSITGGSVLQGDNNGNLNIDDAFLRVIVLNYKNGDYTQK